ncbi:hypothetical protein HWI79_2886 [Cryptosporidium felis]|nr:hypothetical protein HWI79_2886 [Cryptosporidium felis]
MGCVGGGVGDEGGRVEEGVRLVGGREEEPRGLSGRRRRPQELVARSEVGEAARVEEALDVEVVAAGPGDVPGLGNLSVRAVGAGEGPHRGEQMLADGLDGQRGVGRGVTRDRGSPAGTVGPGGPGRWSGGRGPEAGSTGPGGELGL